MSECVTLEYNGQSFDVQVDYDTYLEIISSEENFRKYSQMVYNLRTSTEETESFPAETEDPPSTSHDIGETENERMWHGNKTKLLLELRFSANDKFMNPKCTKKKLWDEIALKMNRHGYQVTGSNCSDKYRSLLKTYRAIKDKTNKTGESSVTWEFYNIMNDVLGTKSNTQPDDKLLGSMFEEQGGSASSENSSSLHEEMQVISENMSESTKHTKAKRKMPEMTMKRYLFEKNKKEERDEDEAKKRWGEKKEIENKKADALMKIAEALLLKSQNK